MSQAKALGGTATLTKKDLRVFDAATEAIFKLMEDGEFHAAEEIILVSNQREGLRRMRQLRGQIVAGYRLDVERKNSGGRRWQYRLTRTPVSQGDLF